VCGTTYVQVDQSVTTHRKTLKLARLLGESRYCVVGRLVALWSWSLDSAVDGVLKDVDAEMLAEIMGWEGQWHKPAELYDALLTAGFTELGSDGLLRIHNWYERMGQFMEQREQRREQFRQGSQRYRDRQKAQARLHLAQADVEDDHGSQHRQGPQGPLGQHGPDGPGSDQHGHGHAHGGANITSTSRQHDASSAVNPKSNVKKSTVTLDSEPSLAEPARTPAHARTSAQAPTRPRPRPRPRVRRSSLLIAPIRWTWRQILSQWYLELQMGATTLLIIALALLLL
jgi:hypothetical protein